MTEDKARKAHIQHLYLLRLAENGPAKIVRMLTEQQISTPGTLESRRT
ncbi:hypothetical protein [Candidatus Allofournierella merdipullorum]